MKGKLTTAQLRTLLELLEKLGVDEVNPIEEECRCKKLKRGDVVRVDENGRCVVCEADHNPEIKVLTEAKMMEELAKAQPPQKIEEEILPVYGPDESWLAPSISQDLSLVSLTNGLVVEGLEETNKLLKELIKILKKK